MQQKFVQWLYLSNGYMSLIKRLVGLTALPIIVFCFVGSRGGSGPYVIPAWRIGTHLLALPVPSALVAGIICGAMAIAACGMIWGFKSKILPAVCALGLAYLASVDWLVAGATYVVMEFVMLVAILMDNPGLSPARRIIQLNIVLCYLITSLQRLTFADFRDGYSMQAMFADGWAFSGAWRPIFHLQDVPHAVWVALSWGAICFESGLGIGLLFKRTRMPCVIIAAIFHLAIAILMDKWLIVFSLAMWTGLLSFVDKKNELKETGDFQPTGLRTALATALMAFLVFFPLRIFCNDRPPDRLAMFDRAPWSFNMYLARPETDRYLVQYQDEQKNWHDVPNYGRMGRFSSDNELYATVDWLLKSHPEATRARVQNDVLENGRLRQEKILEVARGDHKQPIEVHFSEPLATMKLQKVSPTSFE